MSGHKGLHNKYLVFRTDDLEEWTCREDATALDGCFILRPLTDTAARIALAAYAEATHNPRLGADIRAWLEELRPPVK